MGFGTGLQQTKVGATMREMVKLAWMGCLVPTQKRLAGELGRTLMPDFGMDPAKFRMAFDTREVMAMWEEDKDRGERIARLFTSGVIKRGEARRELGLKTEAQDDIYVLPSNVAPATGDGGQPPPPVDGGAGGAGGADGGAGAGGAGP